MENIIKNIILHINAAFDLIKGREKENITGAIPDLKMSTKAQVVNSKPGRACVAMI